MWLSDGSVSVMLSFFIERKIDRGKTKSIFYLFFFLHFIHFFFTHSSPFSHGHLLPLLKSSIHWFYIHLVILFLVTIYFAVSIST